jgi:hypothetical protein
LPLNAFSAPGHAIANTPILAPLVSRDMASMQARSAPAHDDRADADARRAQEAVDRIAEDDLDAFAPEDLRDRLPAFMVALLAPRHTTGDRPLVRSFRRRR